MFNLNDYIDNSSERFKRTDINIVESFPFFYKDYFISVVDNQLDATTPPMSLLTNKQKIENVENYKFFNTSTEPFNILLKNEENFKILENFKEKHEDMQIIDLRSDIKKIVFSPHAEYSHFMRDHVGPVLHMLVRNKGNVEIIILFYSRRDSYHYSFFKLLDEYNIKYKIIEISQQKKDILLINNFYWIPCQFLKPFSIQRNGGYQTISPNFNYYYGDLIYNFYKPLLNQEEPFRKVYLSRTKNKIYENRNLINYYNDPSNIFYAGLTREDPMRIDDEEKIEKFFKRMNFEIVYPEDFENFEEQAKFMSEVRMLASFSSSGLTNALFMHRGQTLIEIITSLVIPHHQTMLTNYQFVDTKKQIENINNPIKGTLLYEQLHLFWGELAFYKEHACIGIPNLNQKADFVIDFILKNKALKFILMN